jgi:hypothetical protein
MDNLLRFEMRSKVACLMQAKGVIVVHPHGEQLLYLLVSQPSGDTLLIDVISLLFYYTQPVQVRISRAMAFTNGQLR